MPKPTKLHDKGKPTSIQKANKPELSEGSTEIDHETAVRQFQLELCWCIQQLERSLSSKKVTDKQMQDTWKTLQVLKNNNQSTIRKRQLMRTHFGDYRSKMQAEEKKLLKMASKMKISEKPVKPKATFLRKSVFQTTGDSSFRFNFNITPEQIGDDNTNTKNKDVDTGNTECVAESSENGSSVTNSGDCNNKDTPVIELNTNTFKFRFSESEFRFNFDVSNQSYNS